MAQSSPSDAVPRMLKWARERSRLSPEAAAAAVKVSVETLLGWETGEGTPSFARLRRLAAKYNRPLYVFYLEKPPVEFTVVEDYRKLPKNVSREFSPGLRRSLQHVQEQREWASEYLKQLRERPVGIVGSATLTDSPHEIGKSLRDRLDLPLLQQIGCESPRAAYSLWRSRCESIGMFVFQTSGVDVAEIRGCALSDRYAPVAIINGRDFDTAKMFTLIHEAAHLLLGLTGVSGGARLDAELDKDSPERFCNRVAAETLVPAEDFIAQFPSGWRSKDDYFIRAAAFRYHVSRAVIGLRLVETGLANQRYLDDKWPSLQPKLSERKKARPPQFRLALARSGAAFCRLAISAYRAGAIHGGELAELLKMKMDHLPRLESQLYPKRVQATL